MKKFTKVLTTAVAVSMIGASFAACSGKKGNGIEGKYSAEYDATDDFIDQLGLSVDTNKKIIVVYELELEDGEYEISADKDDIVDQIIDFLLDDDVKHSVINMMGLGSYSDSELDTMAQYDGYDDFDDYWNQEVIEMLTEKAEDADLGSEGTYEIDDDTVFFTPDDRDSDEFEGEIDGGSLMVYNEKFDTEIEFEK